MANALLREESVERIASEVLPGCRAKMGYCIAWGDFVLQVNYGDQVTQIKLQTQALALSWNDFSEWLKSELPPEWFPKPPAVDAIDFDATG